LPGLDVRDAAGKEKQMTPEEAVQVESSQRQHFETLLHQERSILASQQLEYDLFATLRPRVFQDGSQFCVLHGDDLQSGIAGFGDTVYKAICDFNMAFHRPIKNAAPKQNGSPANIEQQPQ
jgi:hypothetical protein